MMGLGNFITGLRQIVLLGLILSSIAGCSAMYPLEGHSARQMPYEYVAPQRSLQETIDLSLLRQNSPAEHLVDGGDILGVYIEGILGNAQNTPPVFVPNGENAIPSIGYPIRVDMDGTISLPMLEPLLVRGMTIAQVRQAVSNAYTHGDRAIMQPGRHHIHVSLQKPRTYRVIVIREESGNEQGNRGPASTVNFETDKRGTGRVVHLPAHRNDVLNALTETGGLPGLDAENVIYVIRSQQPLRQPLVQQQQINPQPIHPQQLPTQQAYPNHDGLAPPPIPQSQYSNGTVIRGQSPEPTMLIGIEEVDETIDNVQLTSEWQPAIEESNVERAWGQSTKKQIEPASYQPLPQPHQAGSQYGPYGQPVAPDPQAYQQQVLPPNQQPDLQQYPQKAVGNYMPAPSANYGMPICDGSPACLANQNFGNWPQGLPPNVIRIPLKLYPGEVAPFRPEDVILHDGDIVFVENRVKEFYFTAGLLGGGQFSLPRDYDLGVMDAIAIAEAQRQQELPTAAIGGASVLNQDVTVGASKVIVQRKMPDGSRFPIEVDLYDVMEHPEQQIIIQPEDRLILRYTKTEAALAFFERYILEGAVIGATSSLLFRN